MRNKKNEPRITITCAGCEKTQTVRAAKVLRCDYYTCGKNCNVNSTFEHSEVPNGFIHLETMNAAGNFTGHTIRPATIEESQSLLRARALIDAYLQKLERS